MLMHMIADLIANPVITLISIPMVGFLPIVGVLMVATAVSDRVAS